MRASFTIVVIGALVMAGCLIVFFKGHTVHAPGASKTSIGFQYDIVTDPVAQEKGLGGRATVPENYGMLFVFPNDGRYGFWMKDMIVPIDIIWLSDNGTIVGIDADVATSTYPAVFYPPELVRYVLETRAGEALRQGWSTGTALSLPSQN